MKISLEKKIRGIEKQSVVCPNLWEEESKVFKMQCFPFWCTHAQVYCEIGNLTCLRHLFRSTAVAKLKLSSINVFFFWITFTIDLYMRKTKLWIYPVYTLFTIHFEGGGGVIFAATFLQCCRLVIFWMDPDTPPRPPPQKKNPNQDPSCSYSAH